MTINTKYLALLAAVLLLPASAFAQSYTSRAIIEVDKDWNQAFSSDKELTVHLSCTGGSSLEQDVVISKATNGGQFFVYDLSEATEHVFCTVTEQPQAGFSNYEYNYGGDEVCKRWDTSGRDYDSGNGNCNSFDNQDPDNFDGCRFEYDPSSEDPYSVVHCQIDNWPDPATILVNKDWVISGADLGFDGDYKIRVKCDVGNSSNSLYLNKTDNTDYHDWNWCGGRWCGAGVSSNADQGDVYYEFTLQEPTNGGECEVYEDFDDSVVQSETTCPDWFEVAPAGEYECDITNTVFFEGIPTLNQYGMAILALLMLAVGFVGFRRFV